MALQMPSAADVLLASPTALAGPPLMPSAYTVADVPLSINIKPDWSWRHGKLAQQECLGALRVFPRTGNIPPLYEHQAAIQGGCGIGLFVTNPPVQAPAYVDETWERVWQILWPAVNFLTGSYATGWAINLASGIQLLYFDPSATYVFATGTASTSISMEKGLDNIARPRPPGHPIANWIPMADDPAEPDTTTILSTVSSNGSMLPTTITVEAALSTQASSSSSSSQQIPFMIPVSMPTWNKHPPMPLIDCKDALKPLFLFSWFFSFTGATFVHPYGNTRGRCTVAVYLTNPSANSSGMRVRPGKLNVYHEAWKLAVALIYRRGTGGFVNLPNGAQILIYEGAYLDPGNVCPLMTKMSLRNCLDNRAQAIARQATRTTTTTTTTGSAVPRWASLVEDIMHALTKPFDMPSSTPTATSTAAAGASQGKKAKKKGKGKKGG